jgi:hypothetical protein
LKTNKLINGIIENGDTIILWVVIPIAALVSVSFILLAALIFVKYRKNQALLDYVSVNPEYVGLGFGMYLICFFNIFNQFITYLLFDSI